MVFRTRRQIEKPTQIRTNRRTILCGLQNIICERPCQICGVDCTQLEKILWGVWYISRFDSRRDEMFDERNIYIHIQRQRENVDGITRLNEKCHIFLISSTNKRFQYIYQTNSLYFQYVRIFFEIYLE